MSSSKSVSNVSQHDVMADMHNMHNTLASNINSKSVPESILSLNNRYKLILDKSLKGKRFLENRCLVDTVSSDLIKSEKLEEYIGNVFPVVNTGGGNCFFKAFSIFFTGKEDLACIKGIYFGEKPLFIPPTKIRNSLISSLKKGAKQLRQL